MDNHQRMCPVCEQNVGKVLFYPKASPGPISKCQNCSMVYVSKILDSHALIFDGPVLYGNLDAKILTSSCLDDVKDSWELTRICEKESEMPCLRENALTALKRIEALTGKPDERPLLDFGAGFGFFLSVAKERGWKPFGLEPLPATAVYARARFGVEIITDTLHENTFPGEFFEVVTAFQVFEHLPHPLDNLNCLAKSLKRNGVIFIEIPRFDTWSTRLMRSRHRHFVQDHLNFFTDATISLLLKNMGFEVQDNYAPKRVMSFQHLYICWLKDKLPKALSRIALKFLQATRLWDKTISLNFGDMLSIIGRKI